MASLACFLSGDSQCRLSSAFLNLDVCLECLGSQFRVTSVISPTPCSSWREGLCFEDETLTTQYALLLPRSLLFSEEGMVGQLGEPWPGCILQFFPVWDILGWMETRSGRD